jgi:hypothetical protein
VPNSFYPAAKKVLHNPFVKAGIAILTAVASYAVTWGIWPFFKGWASTRADVESVTKIEKKVDTLETSHNVNYERLNSAISNETTGLSHGERVEWLIIRLKRIQEREVLEIKKQVGLEAMLRMPNPRSDAARGVASEVRKKYMSRIKDGEDPPYAAEHALEDVFGN